MKVSPWLVAVASFWCAMNYLLWRSEYGATREGGVPVSASVVFDRLLSAPDSSSLEIRYQGRSMGFVHLYPDPGEEAAGQTTATGGYIPEGMVPTARGYKVRLDGRFHGETPLGNRLQFQLELDVDANRAWRSFRLHAGARPRQVEIRARADDRTLEWSWVHEGVEVRNSMTFDELRDPAQLFPGGAASLGGALLSGPLAAFSQGADLDAGLTWEAWLDWAPFGNSKLRVYRLRASRNGRALGELLLNRAGEVLRVELPAGVRLMNEGLGGF